jgi:hypothetical protein
MIETFKMREKGKKMKYAYQRAEYLIKTNHPIIFLVAREHGYSNEEVSKIKHLESFKNHIVHYLNTDIN